MPITDNFDDTTVGADGWTVNGSDVATQNYSATGGDPGGYYAWTDGANGITNYFVAPSKYLGNEAGYYGGTISWSVLDNAYDTAGQAPDIKITGDGMTITRQILTSSTGTTGGTWTNLSASLSETGWILTSTNAQPTAQQMKDILGNLTEIDLLADYHSGVDNGGLDNVDLVCYRAGTAIRTLRGAVSVEDLAVGDRVATASGDFRAIRWLGHRRVDCRRHATPQAAWPIRIAADAVGANRPARDLYVSPGHAICLDVLGEVLVPAIALVNGTTITQVEVDAVEYWHVELDTHDIIFAENLAAESYIDCGNRDFFVEADVVDLAAGPDALAATPADFCLPFHADGVLVDAARAQLRARAERLGWRLAPAPPLGEVHLEIAGRRLTPTLDGLCASFCVPAGSGDAWLVSTATAPAWIGALDDRRRLGLPIAKLQIDDGRECRTVALDDHGLTTGFHPCEGAHRWTDGRACLPAALWQHDCDMILRLELAGSALPHWIAPDAAPTARDAA